MKRVLLLLLVVACVERETSVPPPPVPRIDTIAAAPTLAINATFRPRRTVYLINCNGAITTGLQRFENGQWTNAWIAEINGCFSTPIVLRSGDARTERIVVRQPMKPGRYRVVWHNVLTTFNAEARTGEPFGDELPIDERASKPFLIEDRTE